MKDASFLQKIVSINRMENQTLNSFGALVPKTMGVLMIIRAWLNVSMNYLEFLLVVLLKQTAVLLANPE